MAKNITIDLETFKAAVDSAYDHIVITDTEGVVVYANQAVERVTGYKIEEVIGKKAGQLWGGLMEKEFYNHMWDIIKNKKSMFVGEIRNKRKGGEEYLAEVRISPVIIDNEAKYFVGVEHDLSSDMKHKELLKFANTREDRIVDLKREINELKKKIGGDN